MTGVLKTAAVAAVVALVLGGAAAGAGGYTGPVAGVPWTPDTLPGATVGVGYSATIAVAPPGATQVAVGCDTTSLTGFPPPPVALNECAHLPAGLTATGGHALTISGTPTTDGVYAFRAIAVWADASGGYSYALESYAVTVSTSSASPPCKCASVGVSISSVTFAGTTATITAQLTLSCTGGSGRNCHGTALLRPPVSAAGKATWTTGRATVPLSCFSPCGHGGTVDVPLKVKGGVFTSARRRVRTRWTIVALPSCEGQRARQQVLTLQFDSRGRLDTRRSRLR